MTENTFDWLEQDNKRYLTTMRNTNDPKIQRAATLLEGVVKGSDQYETIVFGSGKQPSYWGGDMKDVLDPLLSDSRITSVEFTKLPWPDQ
ncbi:MAG: hypothetical protein AAGF95_05125 [Chloroflexota bacterium]